MVLFTGIEMFPYKWEKWGRSLCLASPSRYATREGKPCCPMVCWRAATWLGAHWHRASSHYSKGRWGAALQPQEHPWNPMTSSFSSNFPATALQSPREHMKIPARQRRKRGRGRSCGCLSMVCRRKLDFYSLHLTEERSAQRLPLYNW